MRTRNFVLAALLAVCCLQSGAQTLIYATGENTAATDLPDDPGQEALPLAQPEPVPATGVPVRFEAHSQSRVGDILTLTSDVVVHYKDYILRADKVVYNQSTSELEAEGHLQVSGGPNDVLINASHGDMRLNMHTARFYDVNGSVGVRSAEPHDRLFHGQPVPFFRQSSAPNRRRQFTASSTAP